MGAGCGVPSFRLANGGRLSLEARQRMGATSPCAKALKWCGAKGGQRSATGETGPGNRGPGTVAVSGGPCASPASASPDGASHKSRGGRSVSATTGLPDAALIERPPPPRLQKRRQGRKESSSPGHHAARERESLPQPPSIPAKAGTQAGITLQRCACCQPGLDARSERARQASVAKPTPRPPLVPAAHCHSLESMRT